MDSKERFSLLILEPNEIYFEDFAVTFLPSIQSPVRKSTPTTACSSSAGPAGTTDSDIGRLKICSKSIVYVPRSVARPILKIPLRDCADIYHWPQGLFEHNSTGAEVLAVRCKQIVSLLAGNRLAPYEFSSGNAERLLRFRLQYARVEQHLQMLGQLRRAATLHAIEQNDMIATIVLSRNNRLQFNRLWLDDFAEPILIDCIVDEISPLVTNPGRLLLTAHSVYFQPFNNILPYPVSKIPLSSINTITKRRILLRHTGLEMLYSNNTSTLTTTDAIHEMLYVSFRSISDRFDFLDALHRQSALQLRDTPAETMTLRWQNGLVSNYDYLLHLNSRADRTRRDLTQYPIFPWILCDYTSNTLDLTDPRIYRDLRKPIGALDDERLRRLRERCDEMGEPKFLYGSHYSAPGLVLFYLVRQHPGLMLCLQNGHFDHPDRMFNSVAETFQNCLRNMSDFKELIPEFYDTSTAEHVGVFLLNTTRTNFGIRCTGQPVNHVQLPPWAQGSPQQFVNMLREALESEHVSRNLHHWIDLIFGYKQCGEEARKADNLFYHLCYEGSVDLDRIPDLAARHALEVQISEFGQIPKQLFDKPHVQRLQFTAQTSTVASLPAEQIVTTDVGETMTAANVAAQIEATIDRLELCAVSHSHKDLICCVSQLAAGNHFMSTGKDGLLKWYDLDVILERIKEDTEDNSVLDSSRQLGMPCRSVAIGKEPLSACAPISGSNRVVLSSWNDSILTYNMDYGRITNSFKAHDDVVSCLSLVDSENLGLLVSGSWDCSVKVWSDFGSNDTQQSFRSTDSLLTYMQLDDKIATVHAIHLSDNDDDNNASTPTTSIRILIGTFAGDVHLWTVKPATDRKQLRTSPHENTARRLHRHGNEVTAVRFGPAGRRAASCGLDGVLIVSDVQTGMRLLSAEHNVAWCCLTWLPPVCLGGSDDDLILLGDDRGAVSVWSMRTGEGKRVADAAFGDAASAVSEATSNDANSSGLTAVPRRRSVAVGRGGLVSALAATRQKIRRDENAMTVEADGGDDVVLVLAAGVDGPGDFSVKVFRVIV